MSKVARDRSEAARKGWATRRAREARERALFAARSAAAKRGWVTRRQNERKEKLRVARDKALAPNADLHGRNRDDWYQLREMARRRDERFKKFFEEAEELGFTGEEIRDEWFSPEM